MIEKEMKIMLSKDQYNMINKEFQFNNTYVHINFYYSDSKNELFKENITVRVRKRSGSIFLQVKIPVEMAGKIHIKEEYEKEINAVPDFISGIELSQLCGRKIPDVKMIGFLITERHTCNMKDMEVCLDKNEFLGKIDYELEIEYKSEIDSNIIEILKRLNLNYMGKSEMGKYGRFYKEYEKNSCYGEDENKFEK